MNLNKIKRRISLAAENPMAVFAFLRNRIASWCPGLKDPTARRIARWGYGNAPRLEIGQLFPGIQDVTVTVTKAFDRTPDTSVTAEEALYIAAIVRKSMATRILEIGTFDGNTTLNLATNATENSMVTTVDLPPDWDGQLGMEVSPILVNVTDRNKVGRQFQGTEQSNRIRQVYGDSATLDWASLGAPFDLIFIDGCHSYDYVKKDTVNAIANLKDDGIILWHDYGFFRDVSIAVDEFVDHLEINVICGTRIAVGKRRPVVS
jgi:hypothetical protein